MKRINKIKDPFELLYVYMDISGTNSATITSNSDYIKRLIDCYENYAGGAETLVNNLYSIDHTLKVINSKNPVSEEQKKTFEKLTHELNCMKDVLSKVFEDHYKKIIVGAIEEHGCSISKYETYMPHLAEARSGIAKSKDPRKFTLAPVSSKTYYDYKQGLLDSKDTKYKLCKLYEDYLDDLRLYKENSTIYTMYQNLENGFDPELDNSLREVRGRRLLPLAFVGSCNVVDAKTNKLSAQSDSKSTLRQIEKVKSDYKEGKINEAEADNKIYTTLEPVLYEAHTNVADAMVEARQYQNFARAAMRIRNRYVAQNRMMKAFIVRNWKDLLKYKVINQKESQTVYATKDEIAYLYANCPSETLRNKLDKLEVNKASSHDSESEDEKLI